MGRLASLLSAGVKTGVSVATDLLTNTPMPPIKDHPKNQNKNTNPSNHTRRAYHIDNGFILSSEKSSHPIFKDHEQVAGWLFFMSVLAFLTITFIFFTAWLIKNHGGENGTKIHNDEENLLINYHHQKQQQQRHHQEEEQTTLLAEAEKKSSTSYGGVHITSNRTTSLPIYEPYDASNETTTSSNIITTTSAVIKPANTPLRGTGECSTGIWIVENDTGLRYQ